MKELREPAASPALLGRRVDSIGRSRIRWLAILTLALQTNEVVTQVLALAAVSEVSLRVDALFTAAREAGLALRTDDRALAANGCSDQD
jgi:hypothetical protein